MTDKKSNFANHGLQKWEAPKVVEIDKDISNIRTGFNLGTDASAGPFSTSMS